MAENERGQRSVTESDGKCFWRGRWAQNLAKLLRFSDAEAVGVSLFQIRLFPYNFGGSNSQRVDPKLSDSLIFQAAYAGVRLHRTPIFCATQLSEFASH